MAGYGEKEGIYWIYNKETKKMFRSRDVKFNENTILECSKENVIDMSEFISNNESEKENKELNNQNNFRAEEEAENIVNYQIQNEQIVQNKDQEDNSSIINVKNEVDQEVLSATSSSSIIDKGEEIDNNSQRYPKRNRKPTERYISGECIPKSLKKHQANQLTQSISQIYLIETDFIKEEPVNLRDALKRPEKNEWMKAIESEYESLK
jgi:hypothetical protein